MQVTKSFASQLFWLPHATQNSMEEEGDSLLGGNSEEVRVSLFDYSIENHFNAVDTISYLCEETETDSLNETEIKHLASSVTFLKEWRHYNYEHRLIKFACESETPQQKDVNSGINLPQFSSATVPKKEGVCGDAELRESSTDFVMHVGGSVWGLDWCPRVHKKPDCRFKCEFIAVSAHPPGSYYHKIGAPLTGRGVVQIWCVLNVNGNEETPKSQGGKSLNRPRGRPKKHVVDSHDNKATKEISRPRQRGKNQIVDSYNDEATMDTSTELMRPKGRRRKRPVKEPLDHSDFTNQHVQALAVEYPEDSSALLGLEQVSGNTQQVAVPENKGRKRKIFSKEESPAMLPLAIPVQRRSKSIAKAKTTSNDAIGLPLLTQTEHDCSSAISHQVHENTGQDHPPDCGSDNISLGINSSSSSIPKDVALPRVVLCLAHNGKVAWDVKWQPCGESSSKCQHRMGYLAVLLGNGSLEVWDVPLPHTMKFIYSSSWVDGTDPRFVKLEPVFRCSILKCGEMQSIPLTLEWSTSHPYDYLLAGCHDGMVALWKFSANRACGETRPLLRFSADTFPIRAVAWAPVESDQESGKVILTAGHLGIKFWDIHDPFRPLWNLQPTPKFIYSVDWLPDPRCIVLSFDDGTMRLLSLVKAAYDAAVHGKPCVGPKQQGMHVINCSSYAIWSVQVSRLTGMVAYSSADGAVCRFQLTAKAVEKDPSRHRAPHFMCWSLSEDEPAVTVNTPLPDVPVTLKKSMPNGGDSAKNTDRISDAETKDPGLDDQVLALCYGNDPAVESESEETLASFKTKRKLKPKRSSKKKAGDGQELVPRNEEQEDLQEKESGKRLVGSIKKPGDNGTLLLMDEEHENTLEKASDKRIVDNEIERISPKIVAMHRVRWNMNKGSERWLCSGGGAGIIRCQEIVMSGIVKGSTIK